MGLTYFIMHASCFSAKDSKRGVCRTQKACRSLYYLSEPIEKESLLGFYGGGGVGHDTYFGGFYFFSSAALHATNRALHAMIPLNIFSLINQFCFKHPALVTGLEHASCFVRPEGIYL